MKLTEEQRKKMGQAQDIIYSLESNAPGHPVDEQELSETLQQLQAATALVKEVYDEVASKHVGRERLAKEISKSNEEAHAMLDKHREWLNTHPEEK